MVPLKISFATKKENHTQHELHSRIEMRNGSSHFRYNTYSVKLGSVLKVSVQ